jgi:hypothetical protein
MLWARGFPGNIGPVGQAERRKGRACRLEP